MKPLTYRLPDDSIPVLVSAETRDLLYDEAAALLSYATDHPEVAPQEIADMLFRTRAARRHRALAMVADRDELLGALRAVLDGAGTSFAGSQRNHREGPQVRLCLSGARSPAPRDGPGLL